MRKPCSYVGSLNGVETVITSDEQMFECINNGGTILAIDDEGEAEFVGDSRGFLRGRPCFPKFTKAYEKRGKEHEKKLKDEGKKRQNKRKEKGKTGYKMNKFGATTVHYNKGEGNKKKDKKVSE